MEKEVIKFESEFSIDCVIFGFEAGELKVLLIERKDNPYKEWLALPGNLVMNDEGIEEAAVRILHELTGLNNLHMEQFHTFGAVNRHPRGRIITVAYYALIRIDSQKELRPGKLASKALWHSVTDLPKLAFDHTEIFKTGFHKLRRRLSYQPIAYELLPEKFTLTQLQQLYEAILNKKLDKRNFRKKMLSYGFLKELDEKQKNVSFRAAKLYKFDRRKYSKIFQNEIGVDM
ncbi:NUDIX domain-containing protein [Mucilaginibacter daejeonensis]|uniref:NUDIX hydrolase n=1 Tax=Mucilaginibacter daejeonensis TaxID=398049 RepID=UPI001D173E74|nr:NUDIX domain-containing protein [Mucilaginibacter daejeonensis]UEG54938.1 NUDIX domain-containing protein [Mucilaginibacter daejeonensis]